MTVNPTPKLTRDYVMRIYDQVVKEAGPAGIRYRDARREVERRVRLANASRSSGERQDTDE